MQNKNKNKTTRQEQQEGTGKDKNKASVAGECSIKEIIAIPARTQSPVSSYESGEEGTILHQLFSPGTVVERKLALFLFLVWLVCSSL